jgi:hypothetical protein
VDGAAVLAQAVEQQPEPARGVGGRSSARQPTNSGSPAYGAASTTRSTSSTSRAVSASSAKRLRPWSAHSPA